MSDRPDRANQIGDDVARGCRRIVGFVVLAWIAFGSLALFAGDTRAVGTVIFPLGIFIAAMFIVSRVRRAARNRESDDPQVDAARREPTPPSLPGRRESRVPSSGPKASPEPSQSRATTPLPTPRSIDPGPDRGTSSPPPSSLEEALAELGIDPDPESGSLLGELGHEPKSSQEMIEEARRKWGADRDER